MLKKYLALLFFSTAFCAQAQVGEPRSELCVGVNAGVSLNKIDFTPTIQQYFHVSPIIGISFRYTCEKYFSTVCALQAELNYTSLGWRENIIDKESNPLPDTYRRDLHYLQLPLLARLGWGREQRGLMFYVLAGPQIGYCFGESTTQSAEWTTDDAGVPIRPGNVTYQYGKSVEHKLDYGITAGLGLELSTKIGHFDLEGRYYYGLGDIYGNSKKDFFSRSANGTIIIKLAYLMNLGKK